MQGPIPEQEHSIAFAGPVLEEKQSHCMASSRARAISGPDPDGKKFTDPSRSAILHSRGTIERFRSKSVPGARAYGATGTVAHTSVVDQHRFDVDLDPDPTFHFGSVPDRIRIIRTRRFSNVNQNCFFRFITAVSFIFLVSVIGAIVFSIFILFWTVH